MKEKCKKQQKKNKRKGARGTEAIVKWCELNDFAVHLS